MAVNNVEIRDENGNVYQPRTTAANVTTADGTSIEEKLAAATAASVLDFDILCSTKGYSNTITSSNGSYTETLKKTATGKRTAVRTTTKLSNGYREVTTFYEDNGTTVKETRTKTITKTSSGYSEAVT